MGLYDPKFTLSELQLMMKGYRVIGQVVDGVTVTVCPTPPKQTIAGFSLPTKPFDWNSLIPKMTEELSDEDSKKMMDAIGGLSDENLGISASDNNSDFISQQAPLNMDEQFYQEVYD